MKYLKIQNDGLLDIRLVALMGGTTKAEIIWILKYLSAQKK
jgi:hypothetical protein